MRVGRFYFKPEAGGRLWLSPHDETPSEPCDCAPEEIDVALAIDRLRAGGRLAGRAGRAQLGGPAQLRARPAAGLRLRRAARRTSSGSPGRAASASRPRRRRRGSRRRCCLGRRRSIRWSPGSDPEPYRAARFTNCSAASQASLSARSFSAWPAWPFTQCQSIRCGAAASSSSCHSSAFLTGFRSAVRQPFRCQPWIHLVMPSRT